MNNSIIESNNQFLSNAYIQILLRPIDESGLEHYRKLLSLGVSRNQILRIIRNSKEAFSLNRSFSRIDVCDLIALNDDRIFLERAYDLVFAREIDPQGLTHFLSRLKNGSTRKSVLSDLFDSEEYKRKYPLAIRSKLEGITINIYKFLSNLGLMSGHAYQSQQLYFMHEINEKATIINSMELHINNEIQKIYFMTMFINNEIDKINSSMKSNIYGQNQIANQFQLETHKTSRELVLKSINVKHL
jgi:hypothetical protein